MNNLSELKQAYIAGNVMPERVAKRIEEVESAVYNGYFHLTMELLVSMYSHGFKSKEAIVLRLNNIDPDRASLVESFLNGEDLMKSVKSEVVKNFDLIVSTGTG